MHLSRRDILKSLGAASALSFLPTAPALAGGRDSRFIYIVLRGGMDGLHAVPPVSDPVYRRLRRDFDADYLPLDNGFALHPSLTTFHNLYKAGQMAFMHAASTPYRQRSHFDAQDVLELGLSQKGGDKTGWLARALPAIAADTPEKAIAIAQTLPLALRGSTAATNWAPSVMPKAGDDLYERLGTMYKTHPVLQETLEGGLMAEKTATGVSMTRGRTKKLKPLAEAAGKFLKDPNGPRIAMLEMDGWDTHNRQQNRITGLLVQLDSAIQALKDELGTVWHKTAILVVTEFGRTAALNGSGGTDHGTGSVSFLLGGAINGGRRIGRWSGLGSLYQNRDVLPENDIRSLYKAVLIDHMNLPVRALKTALPGSDRIPDINQLFRV